MTPAVEGAGREPSVVCINNISVPAVVLGREDCDPSLEVPPELVPEPGEPWPFVGTALRIRGIRSPTDMSAGDLLALPALSGGEGGEPMRLRLPGDLAEGELVYIVERPRNMWHAKRVTAHFAHAVPEQYRPGDEMTVALPDGTQFSFPVPSGLDPWQIISWKMEPGGSWELEQCYAASPQQSVISESVAGPVESLLANLRIRGYLDRLPLADGILRVSVPCCGRFGEYAVFGRFFSEHCLTLPGVEGISIFATDYNDTYTLNWAVAESWFGRFHPRIRFRACAMDLVTEPLPEASLTITLHPEVTRGGVWFPIIGSVLRTGRCGLCAFATFYEDELRTLQNMVDMYRAPGGSVEEAENPYYEGRPLPEVPRVRFLTLVAGSGVRPPDLEVDELRWLPLEGIRRRDEASKASEEYFA